VKVISQAESQQQNSLKRERVDKLIDKFQRFSWLCFFFFLLTVLIYAHIDLAQSQVPAKFLTGSFSNFVAIFMVLQLLLGLYQLIKNYCKLGLASLIGSLIYICGTIGYNLINYSYRFSAIEDLFALSNYSLYHFFQFTEYAVDSFFISLTFNALIFGSGLIVSLLYYRKLGKSSFAFPLIYLILLSVLFAPYHASVQSYRQQLADTYLSSHSKTLPLFERASERRYQETEVEMDYIAWTLPPFSHYALYANLHFLHDQHGALFDLWDSLKIKALSRGLWHDALTSPGVRCGGTLANWDDRRLLDYKLHTGSQSNYQRRLSTSLFLRHYLIDKYGEREKDFVPLLYERCQEQLECKLDRQEIREAYQAFVSQERQALNVLQQFVVDKWKLVDRPNYPALEVDDCSQQSRRTYGLRIKNLECGSENEDLLNLTLIRTDHSPVLEFASFDLYVYSSLFPEGSLYEFNREIYPDDMGRSRRLRSKFQSGKEIDLTYNTTWFDYYLLNNFEREWADSPFGEGFVFQPGGTYAIEIDSSYGSFSVYAFCKGNSSFHSED